jgi:hypothetical protein
MTGSAEGRKKGPMAHEGSALVAARLYAGGLVETELVSAALLPVARATSKVGIRSVVCFTR